MNPIGTLCFYVFIAAVVAGIASGFYFLLFQALCLFDRSAVASNRRADYERHIRRGQSLFLWCWIAGAVAFGLGAWIGGWNVDY
ncbi:MAG: hypothetical protein DCF16_06750 [Alphaproteobacteria bacterium]|nr:MAG: hypothetical protein DCF16_06750 [Alphaproteobacteria bacterium]